MADRGDVGGKNPQFRTDTVYLPSSPKWSSITLLLRRQIEPYSVARDRLACLVARNRILASSATFDHVWSSNTRQPACFGMDRRFHLDNHERCFFMDGLNCKPRLLYQLPHAPAKEKISIVMQYFLHVRPGRHSEEETSVITLALRDDGYLLVMNADTGVVLHSIFLSSVTKYRYLSWADYLYTIQVKSVLHPQIPQGLRRDHANPASYELVRFVIFDVHPLQLKASFKIDKQVFGLDVSDASIDGDILIVYITSKNLYRIYNLKELLDKNLELKPRLGDRMEGKVVGRYPMEMPLTVHIKQRPPALLEVTSGSQNGVSFGGCPFHYLHSSPKETSLFILRAVGGGKPVKKFSSSDLTLNSDLVEFHFDDYQRLFQIVGGTLRCYFMSSNHGEDASVSLCYTIDFKDAVCNEPSSPVVPPVPLTTRSGRRVKRRVHSDSFTAQQCLIHEVDYENELDLTYAVVTYGENHSVTSLVFFDDWKGNILKVVPLETWLEDSNNSIHFELCSIIHQCTTDTRNHCCSMYTLKHGKTLKT